MTHDARWLGIESATAIATVGVALGLVLALAPCEARADAITFYGPHPTGPGAWDASAGAHVAATRGIATDDEIAIVEGVHVFVGDPLLYGYSGAVWTFDGVHPLPGGIEGYCALEGAHRHAFAPDTRDYAEVSAQGATAFRFTGALHGGWPSFLATRRADASTLAAGCDPEGAGYDAAAAMYPVPLPYPVGAPRWRAPRRTTPPPPSPRAPIVVVRRPRPPPPVGTLTAEPFGTRTRRGEPVTTRPSDGRRGRRR